MKLSPELSPQQWSFVAYALQQSSKTLPKSGKYGFGYDATNGNLDELYYQIREHALSSAGIVQEIIGQNKAKGSWPRGKYEAKFWLKTRWETGILFAELKAARSSEKEKLTTQFMKSIVKWMLYEGWSDFLVDYWLSQNLSNHTYFYSNDILPEKYTEYFDWIRLTEQGHYIRKQLDSK